MTAHTKAEQLQAQIDALCKRLEEQQRQLEALAARVETLEAPRAAWHEDKEEVHG